MATQSELNPLHDIKSLLRSSLPTLCYTAGYSTVNESVSDFILIKDQLQPWEDFEGGVRDFVNSCLPSQAQFVATQTEKEVVYVGNEQGLMGRFGQNVCHVMGEIYLSFHLQISFADYQAGKPHDDVPKFRNIPDLVLVDDHRLIRAVGEGKTFWTRDLTKKDAIFRAAWYGQLARYMDDLKLRYGFYTTYNATVFIRRTSDTTFEESPPILHCTTSTGEGRASLRECFLYLAKLASSDLYKYPKIYGRHLTDGCLIQRERISPRTLVEGIKTLKLSEGSKDSE